MDKLSVPTRCLYRQIHREVSHVQFRWDLFHRWYDTDEETTTMVRNSVPLFFKLYETDLLDSVILGIARLADPPETQGKRNANLQQLISYLGGFYPELREQLDEHLSNIRENYKRIKDWRNEWIAHKDYHAVIRPIPGHGVLGVNRKDINDALSELWAFLNAFEKEFCDDQLQIDPSLPIEEQMRQVAEYDEYKVLPPAPVLLPDDAEKLLQWLRAAKPDN